MKWFFIALLSTTFCVASDSPIAPGAELQLLSDGFKFTEGPTADKEGNVYFTDQPNDRILRWSVSDGLSTFLEPCGRSNGLFMDAKGMLWACADDRNELWRIDPATKKHEVIVKDFEGKLLNGPNDVWVHPNGSVYFSDPFFKRPYWNRGPSEQEGRFIYRVSPDLKKVERVSRNINPNGVVGTADGKKLFAAAGGIQVFDIQEDGSLANQRKFFDGNADGMTLDEEGNLYLAAKGVTIVNKDGEKIGHIEVPEKWSANVCFGGADHKTLFITASKGLYAIQMRVRGVNP